MKIKVIIIFLIIFTIGYSKNNQKIVKGYFDLTKYDFEKSDNIKLDGEWEFYWNKFLDEKKWKNRKTSEFSIVKLPGSWIRFKNKKGVNYTKNGFATFRMKLKINDLDKLYGLYIGDVITSYKLYINGDLLISVGQIGKNEKEAIGKMFPQICFFKSDSEEIEILIKVSNFDYERGGIWKSVVFGTSDKIFYYKIKKVIIDVFIVGCIFIMMAYHFGLFLMRKDDKPALLFALFSFSIGMRVLFVNERLIHSMINFLSYSNALKLELFSVHFATPIFLMFIKSLFPKYVNKYLYYIMIIIYAMFSIITNLSTSKIYIPFIIPFELFAVITCAYIIYILIRELINKNKLALYILLGFMIIFLGVINDVLHTNEFIDTTHMLPMTLVGFIIFQSYILAKRFSDTFKKVEILGLELKNKNIELKNNNKELEKIVERRTSEIREKSLKLEEVNGNIVDLLDNAGEGFLTFGKDMKINKEYSKECINIFKKKIYGNKFTELIDLNKEDKEDFEEILQKLFQPKIKKQKELMYIQLLIKHLVINDRTIKIEYKILKKENKELMLILTDITEKINLENQIEKERNNLRMVVESVVSFKEVSETLNEYKNFVGKKMKNLMSNKIDCKESLYDVLSQIHTFKGNFSQIKFYKTAKKLHEFESILIDFQRSKKCSYRMFEDIVKRLNPISFVKEEIEVLENFLGNNYLNNKNVIVVEEEKIIKIENRIRNKFQIKQANDLIKEIKKLRFKSIKELIFSYNRYVQNIALSREKLIYDIEVKGDNIFWDFEKYYKLYKSFVHIFRNIVDHGIETEKIRESSGKNIYGKILVEVIGINNELIIRIVEDGCGLDIDAIKEKIINNKLLERDEVDKIDNKEIINYIFKEDFSTKKEISELSGRGIGLYAVKKEVDKLNGEIFISNGEKSGTVTTIKIFDSESVFMK